MADSSNVTVATPPIAGTFSRGVAGTTLPVDSTTALAAAFEDLGYVGEDGYAIDATRDTSDIKAFGGDTVATVQSSFDETVTVTLLEDKNVEVLKTVFGDDNVDDTTPDNIKVLHNKSKLPRSVFVIDVEGEGDSVKRLVIPEGQVTGVGTITLVHTDVVKYQLTIKCYPDTAGNNVYEYDSIG